MALQRGAPFVAPREMRGEQGNPEITTYCPKCDDRVVVLRSGLCGWCDTDLSAGDKGPDKEPDRVETPNVAKPQPPVEPAIPPETVDVARWRRDEIANWLLDNGPATQVEIMWQFALTSGVVKYDLGTLRGEGRIQRTGEARSQAGHGGRPSPEFRAVEANEVEPPTPAHLLGAAGEEVEHDGKPKTIAEAIAERRDAGMTVDPTPFSDRPGASEETRRIGEEVRRELEARYADADEFTNRESRITIHQQLTVRYLDALIGWVQRSSHVRDDGPPEHVYDRIERLLGIADGVA